MNTYLNVPYEEKDFAKGLGAKWDSQKKLWYVKDGVDITPFQKWLSNDGEFEEDALTGLKIGSPFYLIESIETCWKCKSIEKVIALACYRCSNGDECETLDATEEDFNDLEMLILNNIKEMPNIIFEYVLKAHPHFKKRYSKTHRAKYYMNICSKCDSQFGDFFLHNEPEGAFFPIEISHAQKMVMVKLPFEGIYEFKADYSFGAADIISENAIRKTAQ